MTHDVTHTCIFCSWPTWPEAGRLIITLPSGEQYHYDCGAEWLEDMQKRTPRRPYHRKNTSHHEEDK